MCRQQQVAECKTQIGDVMEKYLGEERNFTGKMVFTVNCRNGGIGNVEAFIQNRIEANKN